MIVPFSFHVAHTEPAPALRVGWSTSWLVFRTVSFVNFFPPSVLR
jgi:hypothetical protein